jgi:hypothetical protein
VKRGGRVEHYVKERDGEVITFDWLGVNWKLKHGQYFVCDAWSRDVVEYLGKYLSKDALIQELRDSEGRRIRKFSSSRFELVDDLTPYLKMAQAKELDERPDLEGLYWRRDGSKLVGRGKEVVEKIGWDGAIVKKIRYPKVRVIRGEWQEVVISK